MAETVSADPEHVEMRLVARIVDPGDHLRHVILVAGHLAHDQVVLVVAGHGHDQVGALDPGPLQHVQLGGIAEPRDVLELLFENAVAVAIVVQQRHLVAHLHERRGQVRPHLAATNDQDIHGLIVSIYATAPRPGVAQIASMVESIAAEVAQTVRRPCVE